MQQRGERARGRGGRPRVRALLAGGIVLGLGVSATLASWTDEEHASGAFTTSTFDLESSLSSTGFASHAQGDALALQFGANGLAPGSTREEQVFLRTTPASLGGTVVLDGGSLASGDAAFGTNIVYRAVRLDAASCSAASFGAGAAFLAGGSASYVPLGTAATAVPLTAGNAVGVCLQISLLSTAPNTLQGKSAQVQFVFTGTSGTP